MVDATEAVRRWLKEAVIGLQLCPFAAPVFEQGTIRFASCAETDAEEALRFALEEVRNLLETPEEEVATTLIIFEQALSDFHLFLDVAVTLEEQLAEAGAEGIFQLATFHPDYQFHGAGEDAIENFTNRAPYPVFHLLREDQVAEAVESHPDAPGIPERNMERLRSLGRDGLESIWSKFSL